MEISELLDGVKKGDRRSLARAISWVENEMPGYEGLLHGFQFSRNTPVIGITGPPGAGKSTLINALIKLICSQTNDDGYPNTVGVIAVDPSSPFTHGSLLGDRLRMQEHFTNPQVFIRSIATRGALGGLSAKTLEACDVLRASNFDYIFIETVGVGQSEVEIIGLADTVVVTLVPEAGDEIQALKSGIMEIGDIFVVNKMDRAGADLFAAGIIKTLHERPAHGEWVIPVLKTNASAYEGIEELLQSLKAHSKTSNTHQRLSLVAERAYRLIQQGRMRDVSVKELKDQLATVFEKKDFNLYRFVKKLI